MATIYDVAKAAGVSPSTVSRVLNNKAYITDETRKKVEKAIRETGYTPNFVSHSMIARRSGVIGVIVPDLRNPHHSESAFVIEHTMNELGYSCILCNSTDNTALSLHYLDLLVQRKVEGIILVGSFFMDQAIRDYLEKYIKNLPIVIANGYLDLPNVYGVLSDDEGGIQSAIKHLFSRGKREILYVQSTNVTSSEAQKNSYLQTIRSLRKEPAVEILKESNLQSGYNLGEKVLNKHRYVNGIIFDSPLVAIGCCQKLRQYGIRIPKDISIVTVDNVLFNEICTPTLTSIDNQIEQLAVDASRTISDLIRGVKRPKKILVSTELVIREST